MPAAEGWPEPAPAKKSVSGDCLTAASEAQRQVDSKHGDKMNADRQRLERRESQFGQKLDALPEPERDALAAAKWATYPKKLETWRAAGRPVSGGQYRPDLLLQFEKIYGAAMAVATPRPIPPGTAEVLAAFQ